MKLTGIVNLLDLTIPTLAGKTPVEIPLEIGTMDQPCWGVQVCGRSTQSQHVATDRNSKSIRPGT